MKKPNGIVVKQTNTTGLRPKRRGNFQNETPPIVYPPRKPAEITKAPIASITGPSTGIRASFKTEEKMGGHFRYTPINLTVYTAAYSGAISGLVGSSRWLLDSTTADYVGFTRIAGAFAMSFDLAWEADPDTNPPDTLQVFVIEKTCKAVWEDRDTLANARNTNSSTFTQVSEAIIALILASESYFSGQGITPDPWPSGGGGGGVTEVLPGTGIGISGPIDTPTVTNEGVLAIIAGTSITITGTAQNPIINSTAISAVDAGTGISVSTLSGVATVTNDGILAVDAGAGIGVSTVSGVATVSNDGILAVDAGAGIGVSTVSGVATVSNTLPLASPQDGLDFNSLIIGDPSSQEWSLDPNAPLLTPNWGGLISTSDGFIDGTFINVDGAATGLGPMWQYFVPPPGCTQVAIEFEGWLPFGIGAATVGIQLRDTTGTVLIASGTAILTLFATTFTLLGSVTPGTEYRAYFYFNGNGSSVQAQAQIRSFRVRPTIATDPFFTSGFYRINCNPRLMWDNCYSGVTNYRYQAQSEYSQFVFDTTATEIYLDLYSNAPAFQNSNTFDIVLRDLESPGNGRAYTKVISAIGILDVQKVTLPAGLKRVSVISGDQIFENSAGIGFNQVAGAFIRGVMVPSSDYCEVVPPPAPVESIKLYGDSIISGFYSNNPPIEGLPNQLRRLYPINWTMEAWGGRTFYSDAPNNPNAIFEQLVRNHPNQVLDEMGTNDWGELDIITWPASTYGMRVAQLYDKLNTAGIRVVAMTPIIRALENIPNSFGNTLDDFRNAKRLAAATRPWVTILEGLGMVSLGDLIGGIHPNDLGQSKMARRIAASAIPYPQPGNPPLITPYSGALVILPTDLTSVTTATWWRSDAVATRDSGTNVSSVYDKVSGLNHITTAGPFPAFMPQNPNAANRQSTIFDGSGQILSSGPQSTPLPWTWVIVYRMTALFAPGTHDILVANGSNSIVFAVDNTPHTTMYNGLALTQNVGDTNIHVAIMVFDGATSILNVDGIEVFGSSGATTTDPANVTIGGLATNTRNAEFEFMEFWNFEGIMGATDRASTVAGMRAIYNF